MIAANVLISASLLLEKSSRKPVNSFLVILNSIPVEMRYPYVTPLLKFSVDNVVDCPNALTERLAFASVERYEYPIVGPT